MASSRDGRNLDLSLTGSQILSARSTKSVNNRPSSSGSRRVNSQSNGLSTKQDSSSRKRINSVGNTTPTSTQLNSSRNTQSVPLTRGVSDEFLAFFESQGARPKVKNKSPSIRKALYEPARPKSSAFPGSTESTPRSARSRKTNTTASNHTRHSIFRPDSPFSISTVEGGDATIQNTPQSTARSNGSITDRLSVRSSNAQKDTSVVMNNEVGMATSPGLCLENKEMIYNSVAEVSSPRNQSPRVVKSQARASTSNHKDLNATNNMLPQNSDFKKPLKLELRTMQNSYQNATYNVNKAPVNELQSEIRTSVSKNQAEQYIKRVNMAACIIQHAFKKFVRQRRALRASEAAMKRLLAQKKEEFASKQEQQSSTEVREAGRQKKREERARQARLEAIEELNRRREEEKQRAKEVAEEELAALKASGKVGSKKFVTKSVTQRSKSAKKSKSPRQPENHQTLETSELSLPVADTQDNIITQLSSPRENNQAKEDDVTPVTPSHAGTRTTLDDLMSTLKLLEEEENLPPPPESRLNAWIDATDENQQTEGNKELTAEALEQLNKNTEREQTSTNQKLKNILSFLDEVETKDKLDEIDYSVEHLVTNGHSVEVPGLVVPSAEELEQMEQASAAASEVTNTVLKQRLQLEEKSRTVQMLQKALNQQRELTVRHARETEKEMNKRLDVQKNDYEETVQRHLNFIDQLIDDKKNLGEKCETLVTEMKQIEKKYSEKIKSMQETHDRELAKVKEMITTQEKVKREKWIEEKTKKIKDLTVKGLEPEIQRLIGKHKSELKKLKAVHEAELLQSDERAGQRYVTMTEELRDQLAKEKEAACQRERELAAQRYEKQLQAEEEAYQQARRRLYQEVQEEKERLAQQATRQRQEIDRLQRQLEDSHASSSEMMRKEYEKSREEQERRHQTELQEIRERTKIEKEAWEQNYMKKQEAWLLAKERELKEQVRQERDKEIELVISRLEEDGVEAREECERAAENRIKRIREKYESELEELETSERQAIEKYNQMKAELLEAKGEVERLKVINKQKEQEVDDIKRLSEKLNRERDHVQDVVRQEFADKLVATDEENKRIKQEMAELKSRHKVEIERMKQEVELVNKAKQEEMDAVHSRVKQAIAKKEEVVDQMKQQYQAALKRADHLEGLLEQQRKQLLGGKK